MLLRPDGFRARQARHKTRDQAGLGAADFTSFVGFRDLPIPCATAMSEETSSFVDMKICGVLPYRLNLIVSRKLDTESMARRVRPLVGLAAVHIRTT